MIHTPLTPPLSPLFDDSLGIHGKLQAMPVGRGFQGNGLPLNIEYATRRIERFALQEMARSILREMIERNGKMTYVHQVRNCLRAKITKKKGVTLFYNVEREQANFGNLQRCYSVWNCPICSMTITEGRRSELKQGLANWIDAGGHAYLVTFTNSHHKGDNLGDLLQGQKKAFVKFWEKRKVKEMLKRLGYQGRIVATEVTWGQDNGWHPHYHMIFFFDHEINSQGIQSYLALEWQDACIKAGLKAPDLIHGVDVRNGTRAAEYVSKWGLEEEVTKGHLKKGLNGSLTPFDLLRGASTNNHFKTLFKQFADVFKGKQQLVWSKGLKDLLGIKQVTDEELIEETEKTSIEIRELGDLIWQLILKYEKRAHVLQLVEQDYQNGTNTLYDFIDGLAQLHAGEMIRNSNA
ncbi:protein rep [uncultured Psychrobacter sp.]|uniref:protein rep n=1 Tax=uncultured Psychrobacter sp. TaxID=259303 RepID=UPI002593BA14|nr:protein rep [uncultured Psychrobacter sp.]